LHAEDDPMMRWSNNFIISLCLCFLSPAGVAVYVCVRVLHLETRRVTIVTSNNTVDQDDPKVTNIATPRRMIFAAADDLFAAEAITQSERAAREESAKSGEREKRG
jgi:hypothetical protein